MGSQTSFMNAKLAWPWARGKGQARNEEMDGRPSSGLSDVNPDSTLPRS
jgi:hypothetical protein